MLDLVYLLYLPLFTTLPIMANTVDFVFFVSVLCSALFGPHQLPRFGTLSG